MNTNVSESNVIVDEAIVQPNIKEKVEVKKVLYKVVKRLIDILGGLVGCVLLVPITVAVYIARKVLKEDDGPMFYEQLRIGKNGKEFRFYKFRSMVMNADKKLEKYYTEFDPEAKFLILVAAHNEEDVIESTLENLEKIDYPKDYKVQMWICYNYLDEASEEGTYSNVSGDLKFTYHSCRNLYENRADRSEEDPDMEMLEETMKELE